MSTNCRNDPPPTPGTPFLTPPQEATTRVPPSATPAVVPPENCLASDSPALEAVPANPPKNSTIASEQQVNDETLMPRVLDAPSTQTADIEGDDHAPIQTAGVSTPPETTEKDTDNDFVAPTLKEISTVSTSSSEEEEDQAKNQSPMLQQDAKGLASINEDYEYINKEDTKNSNGSAISSKRNRRYINICLVIVFLLAFLAAMLSIAFFVNNSSGAASKENYNNVLSSPSPTPSLRKRATFSPTSASGPKNAAPTPLPTLQRTVVEKPLEHDAHSNLTMGDGGLGQVPNWAQDPDSPGLNTSSSPMQPPTEQAATAVPTAAPTQNPTMLPGPGFFGRFNVGL